MVEWLAGKRVKGTSSERSGLLDTELTSGVGGWKEIGRTTVTASASDDIDITSLPDKRYLMVISNCMTDDSGNILVAHRFNGDSGYNYNWRYSSNGGSAVVGNANLEEHISTMGINDNSDKFSINYIANYSGKEKIEFAHGLARVNTGNFAPQYSEHVGKWTGTDSINRIYTFERGQTGKYAIGSEVVVLAFDPSDTHTTNFWTELASVDLTSGTSSSIDTGVFEAKKYLWVQLYIERGSGSNNINQILTFNNSTSSYTYRQDYTNAGGTDYISGAQTSQTGIQFNVDNGESFHNMFISNNANKEKLIMIRTIDGRTNGNNNASYVPYASEAYGKWYANTADQITRIKITTSNASSYYGTKTIMKVWGAD